MLDKPDAQFRVGEAAWVVVLMSVCFGFSYLDRNVLTILTQPIKHSLALSDTQIGVLGGFAFSIFIFLGGLPLAWLIDRTNRIRLTAACVFVWSAATIMSGLSTGFAQLLVSRAFTAIAEAALIPAGLSIFADMLPVRRLPLASSVLMIGGFCRWRRGALSRWHFPCPFQRPRRQPMVSATTSSVATCLSDGWTCRNRPRYAAAFDDQGAGAS
jgi:hypothetical protein